MKLAFIRCMDGLHRVCMLIAGTCVVVLTIIIPWGVFTRYVLHTASSWPEPLAVLLMIWFSFVSAAICYRENLHIGVGILRSALSGWQRTALGWVIEILMLFTNLFMVVWGARLVHTTFHQSVAEFPAISVGVSYLPIPIGGAVVVLFGIERLWRGTLFAAPSDSALTISSE